MRNPKMNQDNPHNTASTGLQPSSHDQSGQHVRSNSINNHSSEEDGRRSRASSAAKSEVNSESSRYNKARGPINDAVHSALDPIDPNHTAIPPDLISQITSQITANVLQQLKANQFSPPTSHALSNPDQMDTISSIGGSPPIDRSKVYTPPSPYRASEEAAQTSPTSPRKQTRFPDPRRPPSPPFSHGTLSEDSDAKESNTRRKIERQSTDGDATILEKIWGELFDNQGRSTTRFSQFLRGIAVHLIEEIEPKHSLVVTPDKMQKFYEETRIPNEVYPWHVVFDDRTSSISRMFREVQAQHHLVQEQLSERPDVPGLTPIGFEAWMTLVLKAYPDEEFERLAKTALHMPVSNPDDRKERFPKELSRRQFPKISDHSQADKLQKVILTHCGVKPRSGSMSEKDPKPAQSASKAQDSSSSYKAPPSSDYNLSQQTTRSSIPDIDVNVLRTVVSEAAAQDSPIEVIPPPPIERERKPYVANPGGGKTYDNLDAQVSQAAEGKGANPLPAPPAKLTRSASLNNGRVGDSKVRPTQPISIHQKPPYTPSAEPPPQHQPMRARAGSVYHRDAPRRGDRNRSPSNTRSTEVPHRSDGDFGYNSYHSSSSAEHAPGSWRPDNRYEHRASFSTEPREREREPRQRYHSTSAPDGHRYYPGKEYPSDEEYYRSGNPGYVRPDAGYLPNQQMPPSSYRNRA